MSFDELHRNKTTNPLETVTERYKINLIRYLIQRPINESDNMHTRKLASKETVQWSNSMKGLIPFPDIHFSSIFLLMYFSEKF